MGETMMDRVKAIGLEQLSIERRVAYDFAIPHGWCLETYEITGMWPRGIVWLYDEEGLLGPKCRLFGRPYPVTMYGYWVLLNRGLTENIYEKGVDTWAMHAG